VGRERGGKAITELDGTNLMTANARMAMDVSRQFNAAFGDLRGRAAMKNFIGRAAQREFSDRQSAGSKPTRNVGQGMPCPTGGEIDRFVKAYGGFGTLFGYSWNHADTYGNYGEATDNLLRLGGYGDYQYEVGPGFFQWTTAPTFGIHILSTERRIASMNELAKSDRTAFDFTFFNKLDYTVELPRDFYLTPSYSLAMSYYHDGAYSETGAANAGLHVGDYDTWSLLQNLELKIGKLVHVNDCLAILSEIWGGWEHEYLRSKHCDAEFYGSAERRGKMARADRGSAARPRDVWRWDHDVNRRQIRSVWPLR
jgi:hypothetical protein